MTEKFRRPIDILESQDNFSEREVGLTHPDVSSHVRLRDNGDIEIVTGEGVGILMSRKTRTITLNADKIRFITQDHQGLRWNKLLFNEKATIYSEPTFSVITDKELTNIYSGADAFILDEEDD